MTVQDLHNEEEYETILLENSNKLVVVNFYASWCRPCSLIAPKFKLLSEKYNEVVMIKVDVDNFSKLSTICGVICMPTFLFYKNGEKVRDLPGPSVEKLEETIETYQPK